MPDRFDKFVHNENIKNYERQIRLEPDPVRAAMLTALLVEEKARMPKIGKP